MAAGSFRAAYTRGRATVNFNLRLIGERFDNSFLSLRTVPNAERPAALTTDVTINPGYVVATLGLDVRAHETVTFYVRGDNIGESENISGTVNGALQGLFEGVPAIAISAGSFNGSFDAAFANSGSFMVNFLHELQQARAAGQPLLPQGEALTINVPGNPHLDGVTVSGRPRADRSSRASRSRGFGLYGLMAGSRSSANRDVRAHDGV